MEKRLWILVSMCSLAAIPAWAQETRGNINGVIKDAQGVIPGANVRITNMDPTNTNFGKVTGATNSIMRFFTFVWKVNF